ncbi:ATP-binding protein [Streptomyces longispororuber]|uniref:ATP-binding protein n=1 Tax=Streptomyces longispororuber TaxID=68230 RepID=UPI00210A9CB8|nr:ATP-binding protein [Streptomyces longispororuber]MCQ4207569.1 ATP-binding protein [Streptomyces longispororuber]
MTDQPFSRTCHSSRCLQEVPHRPRVDVPPLRSGECRFPHRLESVPAARRYVCELLQQWGVRGDLLGELAVIASELVTNAVCHTASDTVVVQISLWPTEVVLTVTDEGPGPQQPLAARPADGDREHGRGLLLVEELATRWGAHPHIDGTRVWAAIDVPQGEGSCPAACTQEPEAHGRAEDSPSHDEALSWTRPVTASLGLLTRLAVRDIARGWGLPVLYADELGQRAACLTRDVCAATAGADHLRVTVHRSRTQIAVEVAPAGAPAPDTAMYLRSSVASHAGRHLGLRAVLDLPAARPVLSLARQPSHG